MFGEILDVPKVRLRVAPSGGTEGTNWNDTELLLLDSTLSLSSKVFCGNWPFVEMLAAIPKPRLLSLLGVGRHSCTVSSMTPESPSFSEISYESPEEIEKLVEPKTCRRSFPVD